MKQPFPHANIPGRDVTSHGTGKKKSRDVMQLLKYLKPYRGKVVAGITFIALSNLTTMAFPYLLKNLIDTASPAHPGTRVLSTGNISMLIIAVLIFRMCFSYLQLYIFTTIGEKTLSAVRKDLYAHVLTMPYDFFMQRRLGELVSRISSDTAEIQRALTFGIVEILRGSFTLILGLCLIFYISPRLALVMISIVPPFVLVALFIGKKIRNMASGVQDQFAESGTILQETLQGIANVKSFTNEMFEIKRYSECIDKGAHMAIVNGKFKSVFVSGLLFGLFSIIVLIISYGVHLMQRGLMSFGDLTAFVVYTVFVGGSIAGFAELYSQLQTSLGATRRVWELFNDKTEKLDLDGENVKDCGKKMVGRVSLQKVSFSYPGNKDELVLKDINIDLAPGEKIAIVGPSGAGKSTIISLLQRFYDPNGGKICIDGKDAETISLTCLRKNIALVPQDILLFGGTILDNIRYGNLNATREQVEYAAKQANAHNFIVNFPNQYETKVGDRGMKLSGGQRQRIAIARAILKDPVILILDEATNALDSNSESLVQEALVNLMKNRTSFVVAHRLSTIRNADKIIVLENGVVRECGTHNQLVLIKDGLYQQLNILQNH